MLVFDTASIPRHQRAEAMSSAMMDAALSTNLVHQDRRDAVFMRMHHYQLGAMDLVQVHCSGVRLMRTPRQAAKDDQPVIAVGLHTSGVGSQEQRGARVEVGSGHMFALDMTEPYDHRQIGEATSRIIKIPTDRLGLPPRLVGEARTNLCSSPVAGVFGQHINALVRSAAQLGVDEAAMVGTATIELARALIASAAHDREYARAALEGSLLLRVKAHIRDHLRDPNLTAPAIAAAHHVSVRHLYATFAAADLRIEQLIIRERLEGARHELARPESRRRTIAATSQRWGFANASHFTHRFREAYGISPREWQHLNLPADSP